MRTRRCRLLQLDVGENGLTAARGGSALMYTRYIEKANIPLFLELANKNGIPSVIQF